MRYRLDVYYECGYVEKFAMQGQYLRGRRYKGQRPIKVVCHFMPEDEFLFKNLTYMLHPVKSLGVFVKVDDEELNIKENYEELKLMQLIGALDG